MMKRLKSIFSVMVVSLLLLPQLTLAQTSSPSVVRIGFNYPRSGPYAQIGLSQYQGAKLAIDEINPLGGILGQMIQLVIRDSGSHVRRTKENIRSLLEDENVQMIFGGVSSAVALAACALCQEKWVPFFGTLTYSTVFTGEEAHRACFRESYNSWMAAKLLSNYMNKKFRGQRYFYISSDYTWGWTTEDSIRELTGTTDRGRHLAVRAELGTSNFINLLRQVEVAAPDVLVLTLAGGDLATALRQATVMGLKTRTKIIVPNMIRSDIVAIGPKAMEGVIGAIPWFWQVPYIYNHPRGIQFVERFKAQYNDYPTSAAASAYTILHEYKSAVERAGSFDGRTVISVLEDHPYQIVKDRQTWRAFDHQSIQTVYLVKGKPAAEYVERPIAHEHMEILDSMSGQSAARSHQQWLKVRRKAGKSDTLEPLTGD